jgi:hypothetical protein
MAIYRYEVESGTNTVRIFMDETEIQVQPFNPVTGSKFTAAAAKAWGDAQIADKNLVIEPIVEGEANG